MDDPLLVRVIERPRQLDADLDDVPRRHRLRSLQRFGERLAFDELHRDVRMALVFADVEYRHDVGMRKHACAFRFAQEPPVILAVEAQLRLEQLDRQRTVDLGIEGLVHAGHRAFADDFANLVAS